MRLRHEWGTRPGLLGRVETTSKARGLAGGGDDWARAVAEVSNAAVKILRITDFSSQKIVPG